MSPPVESKDQREILVAWLKEHYNHVRHYETQRSADSNLIVIIAAAILAFVSHDDVLTTGDLPLAILLFFIGAFGIAFVGKYYEYTKANADRYRAYRDKFEELFCDSKVLNAALEEAKAVTRNALPRLAEGGSLDWIKTHRLWITLHAIIAIIGLALTSRIIYKMF